MNLQEFSTLNLIKEIIKANPKLVLELGALAASLR
jgi:digeranylgeranylglycerophospholipid reductase